MNPFIRLPTPPSLPPPPARPPNKEFGSAFCVLSIVGTARADEQKMRFMEFILLQWRRKNKTIHIY